MRRYFGGYCSSVEIDDLDITTTDMRMYTEVIVAVHKKVITNWKDEINLGDD